jgi:pyruvyl transferase EpsI
MGSTSLKRYLKRILPPSAVKALRAIIPAPTPDPFAPFRLGTKAVAEARARWPSVIWPSSARPRAIYALTPTARLRNVGDQAQVVAIERWLARHYPDHPIVELDKDLVLGCIDDLKRRVRRRDLIFLHSGGNLGDRNRWSEAGRRAMIEAFPDNRIVSLPQTIYFSNTPVGRHEREISRGIYGRHRGLTVIGRDEISGRLAKELFPRAQIATMPDFVLSLRADDFALTPAAAHKDCIMLCLRLDGESAFDRNQRRALAESLGWPTTMYDTTLDHDIPAADRLRILTETLSLFDGHRAVVTDRFHGLIFAVLCRKPAVVLPTVDHKLTSAIAWFNDIPNVQLCQEPSEVPGTLERVLATPVAQFPDFNALYFNQLPKILAQWPHLDNPD